MSQDKDKSKVSTQRPALRLVRAGEVLESKAEAVSEETAPTPNPAPRRKSAIAQFMSAYADAIDRDIQMILEL